MSIGILEKAEKRVDEIKSVFFDYTDFLANKSDTIATQVVTPSDPGISVDSSDFIGGKVRAIVSGGTAGETYILKCVVTTVSQGLKEDASISMKVLPS